MQEVGANRLILNETQRATAQTAPAWTLTLGLFGHKYLCYCSFDQLKCTSSHISHDNGIHLFRLVQMCQEDDSRASNQQLQMFK